MNYTPDGSILAVGNHDMNIYLYETSTHKLVHTLSKWSSAILDFDFDKDSKYIRGFS